MASSREGFVSFKLAFGKFALALNALIVVLTLVSTAAANESDKSTGPSSLQDLKTIAKAKSESLRAIEIVYTLRQETVPPSDEPSAMVPLMRTRTRYDIASGRTRARNETVRPNDKVGVDLMAFDGVKTDFHSKSMNQRYIQSWLLWAVSALLFCCLTMAV